MTASATDGVVLGCMSVNPCGITDELFCLWLGSALVYEGMCKVVPDLPFSCGWCVGILVVRFLQGVVVRHVSDLPVICTHLLWQKVRRRS